MNLEQCLTMKGEKRTTNLLIQSVQREVWLFFTHSLYTIPYINNGTSWSTYFLLLQLVDMVKQNSERISIDRYFLKVYKFFITASVVFANGFSFWIAFFCATKINFLFASVELLVFFRKFSLKPSSLLCYWLYVFQCPLSTPHRIWSKMRQTWAFKTVFIWWPNPFLRVRWLVCFFLDPLV